MYSINVQLTSNEEATQKTLDLLDGKNADNQIANALVRVVFGGQAPPNLSLAESKAAIEARYSPLYCLLVDNTVSPEGAFSDVESSMDELD